jgi:hypothetical protein
VFSILTFMKKSLYRILTHENVFGSCYISYRETLSLQMEGKCTNSYLHFFLSRFFQTLDLQLAANMFALPQITPDKLLRMAWQM